jgi:hypothetical protein
MNYTVKVKTTSGKVLKEYLYKDGNSADFQVLDNYNEIYDFSKRNSFVLEESNIKSYVKGPHLEYFHDIPASRGCQRQVEILGGGFNANTFDYTFYFVQVTEYENADADLTLKIIQK